MQLLPRAAGSSVNLRTRRINLTVSCQSYLDGLRSRKGSKLVTISNSVGLRTCFGVAIATGFSTLSQKARLCVFCGNFGNILFPDLLVIPRIHKDLGYTDQNMNRPSHAALYDECFPTLVTCATSLVVGLCLGIGI
jgi:hypothetical protein